MPSAQRVALITGCSEPASLGAAMARDLLGRDFSVYASARRVETMKELAAEGCKLVALDVVSADSIAAAAKVITEQEGRLDILINNAGVLSVSPTLELDIHAFQTMLDINVLGPLRVYQAFAPLLLRTANHPDVANKLHKDTAVIVNISSTSALSGPWQGAYGASKAAMQALSEAMYYELFNMGIHVLTVKLGATRSAMTANTKPFDTRSKSPTPGISLPWYDGIHDKLEVFFRDNVYAKAPSPASVARAINDAATRRNPPKDIWPGMGTAIWRYIWPILPYGLRMKTWELTMAIKDVRRPEEGEMLVLPGKV